MQSEVSLGVYSLHPFISSGPYLTVSDGLYLKCNHCEVLHAEFFAPQSMSKTLGVKINNDLQAAACLRVRWLKGSAVCPYFNRNLFYIIAGWN